VGGVLVAAAAIGMFAAYLRVAAGPDQSFVVARHRIPAGTRLQASDLALGRMELPASLRARAFDDDVGVVVGATVLSPIEAGELVQASALVAKGSETPSRELSFPVDRAHLSTNLREGERVDVLATFGTGNDAVTTSVLRQAVVIALQREASGLSDGGAVIVTLAVADQAEEMALAHAVQLAKLTLVRATGAPPAAGPPPSYRLPTPGGAPDARTNGPS
jgi:Flp pilus assembly protein CpaB